MKVNILFSTSVLPEFTDSQNSDMKKSFNVSWQTNPVECKVSGGRHITQSVIDYGHIEAVKLALEQSGKSPIVIGVWDISTGNRIETDYAFSKVEYEKYLVESDTQINSFSGQGLRDIS